MKHNAAAAEDASCSSMGWGMHPAAYSPWGGQGPAAASLLHEVTRRLVADCDTESRKQRAREARQSLSLALARSVAGQLALRSRAVESTADVSPVAGGDAAPPLLSLFPWWQ